MLDEGGQRRKKAFVVGWIPSWHIFNPRRIRIGLEKHWKK
jgi:hypothetical protein